jgi:hypothetical protein
MAHWAKIDDNNIVIEIIVTDNNDPNGDEGYQWLIDNLGGRWVKTSYNTFSGVHKEGGTPLRKNYATIGGTYDKQRDAFIPPKPSETKNWQGFPVVFDLDEDTCQWIRKVIRS